MRPVASGCVSVLLASAATAAPVTTQTLRGIVLAADGSPAGGAVVWAAKHTYGPLERRETVADGQGRYTLDVDPGTWFIWARRGTQGGEGPGRHESVEIATGRAPEPVTVRLEERGTFRGRLLDAETRKPIPGGQLYLDVGLVLTADANGRFEVGGLYRGGHESFVVAPGRLRMRVLFDTTAQTDTELDVPVIRAGKIVGRVTDLGDKPISGAQVGRHTSGSFFSINGLFLACDADGRFAYDDAVPPGQPTRLSASAPGYEDEQKDGLVVPDEATPLEIAFRLRPKPDKDPAAVAPGEEPRRVVSGVVRGPDTKPIGGVVVHWGYQPYVGAIQTRTDTEGSFRLTVPDKADMLAVLPREYAPQFPKVAAGGDQLVEVTVQEGHTARGRVTDTDGKPISNVRVTAVTPSPDPRIGNPYWLSESAARTDANGKFELKGIPDRARFDFLKPGLSDLRNQFLALEGADNAVTMTYGGAISGRVIDRDGKPIRDFRVLVNFPRERRQDDKTEGYFAGYSGIGVRFTSADGTFVLTGIGAFNVYRISALAEGHGEAVADRVQAVPVNLLAGAEPVTLRAGPPVALRLRAVTAENKQPIAAARVTLVNGQRGLDRQFMWGYHDASWENMVRARTGADGWAEFPSLNIGGATVLVRAPGYGRQRLGWRNGQAELTVELDREATLNGQVRDAAGGPVKGCYVNLMGGGDQIALGRVDDEGRFRTGELPSGPWTVMVRGADGRTSLYNGNVTLKAGETKELLLEVKK